MRNRFAIGIGIWCNGNTTDSGPVIPGSNPGIPTKCKESLLNSAGLFRYIDEGNFCNIV